MSNERRKSRADALLPGDIIGVGDGHVVSRLVTRGHTTFVHTTEEATLPLKSYLVVQVLGRGA